MTHEVKRVFLTWLVPIIFMICILLARFTVGNLLFHALAEFFTITIGVTIMIVAFFTYQFTKNTLLLYLGIGYFWVSLLDFFHTLTFKDMSIYTNTDANVTLTFWILARILEAVVLITAPFVSFKSISKIKLFILFGAIFAFIYWVSFSIYFPDLYIDGIGLTSTKQILEYSVIVLLFIALFIYSKHKNMIDSYVYKYMMLSIVFSIFAEYTFTLYADLHGYIIMLGHLLKFLSFWMIFLAVIKTALEKPFMFLSQDSSTYNAIPLPSIVVDADGIIRQINNYTESFLNLKKDEIIHSSNHKLFHDTSIEESECLICNAIKNGEILNSFELNIKDNTYSFTVNPMYLGNKLTGAVQVCVDLTQRTIVERELKKNKQYLETIFNNEPECVKVVGIDGKLVDMNPTGLGMLQAKTLEEAQSHSLFSYIYPEYHEAFLALHKDVVENGNRGTLEFEIIGLEGRSLWLETHAVPMRDENGNISGLLGITSDVTERKKSEYELKKLKTGIEQSPISIVITDVLGNIEYVNPQFLKVTGYSKSEVLGYNPRILSSGHTTKEEYDLIWEIISQEKKTWSGVFKNITKNGEAYWEAAIISPIVNDKGEVTNYIGIKQDISEKVTLESLLKDQEELIIVQSRHAAMGEMIAMIAHQWRQPLAALSSISLDMQIKSKLKHFDLSKELESKRYEEYVNNSFKEIDNLVNNLSTTIDDFRNFYKSDKKLVNKKLDEVVLKSLKIIKAALINNNIEIIEEYNSETEIPMYDSELIQVVLNILKNAQDNFIEKDIKNRRIEITTKDNFISICDNGGGIETDIKEKIYEPYFSTKDDKNGTGLGLYMSKIIVEEHHKGRLLAKNTNDGVCFKIYINTL